MHVSELVVYPIKSLGGINVDRWPVEKRGLKHDRRWMIVDGEGNFLTARKIPRMATLTTSDCGNGSYLVCAEGMDCVVVPSEPEGRRQTVQVWNTTCEAIGVGDHFGVNEWLSNTLGQTCSLVYMPEDSERRLQAPGAQQGELLSFTDSNPILVASQASIDDLNGRLAKQIPIRRFRPNIVVEGCGPFEEDTWPGLQIGDVQLRFSMKCGRCIFTTIDIDTGETSDEPLRTLNTYRKEGNHVWFGSFYVPTILGEIAVGDRLVVAQASRL